MADLTALDSFLQRARRRSVAGVLIGQAAVASAAGFGATVLLLLLGTQILNWHWVLAVCAGTFLLGMARTLRRVPSPYRLAQQVDRRLGLEDYLSTAHYFSAPGSKANGSGVFRELVCEHASRLCADLRPEAASPIRFPRAAYASLALALLAAGLFAVRYMARDSLDLRPPLAPAIADWFRPSLLAGLTRAQQARRDPGMPPQAGLSLGPETGDGEDSGPPASEESRLAGPRADQYSREAASLLDKMRDAFREMLEELGLTEEARDLAESTSGEGQPGGKDASQGKEKGDASQASPDGSGRPLADQEGDQAAGGDQMSLEAQKRPGQGDSQDPSESGQGSGIGTADGDKTIREAEQEAAMGKLSELLGKRQANLTGEMMVEVTSTKQQKLTTPYSPADAAPGEGGGEIHRDDVPLVYRDYVQQYFERVRREPPAAARSKP